MLEEWWASASRRTRWMVIGALAGGVFGFMFGGIGIAMRGGALGISGPLLFGVAGAFAAKWLENRYPDQTDRKEPNPPT